MEVLVSVFEDFLHLDQALDEKNEERLEKRDSAFVYELCYGVMRWHPRLQWFVNSLLDKPLKKKDLDLSLLMMVGIYQIEYMRTPEHAAVSATVDACDSLGKKWGRNLVNAILRRYQREKEQLQDTMKGDMEALFAHPTWLIEKVRQDWPQYWQNLLEINNKKAAMHLRVNAKECERDEYLSLLSSREIAATPLPLTNSGINLIKAVDINQLPGFSSGSVSVQDQGAQLAAQLLDLKPNQRVLDACAAPGGKSAHILEQQPDLAAFVAIDRTPQRVRLLEETRNRLQLSFQIVEAEAQEIENWWDGQFFDRILLDAPCSASGIVRRHPDIKALRTPGQIQGLQEIQSSLLQKLWLVLKPGGKMLYCTCSLFHDENDMQIDQHLQANKDARIVMAEASWGTQTRFGRQTLPIENDTDAFYYALLEKADAS